MRFLVVAALLSLYIAGYVISSDLVGAVWFALIKTVGVVLVVVGIAELVGRWREGRALPFFEE
jgi:hypothetical protein